MGHPSSPAARLGNLIHRVLRDLLGTRRELLEPTWESAFDAAWERAAEHEHAAAVASGAPRPIPGGWPNYEIKRIRARRLAASIRSLVEQLPDIELFPELELAAFDGRLRGFADLVIRGPSLHAIIDYKSGLIFEDDGEVKASYRRQLLIYAAIEAAITGSWPAIALFPLRGAPAWIQFEIRDASELADDALQLLEQFNLRVPGKQPALPAVGVCGRCVYSPDCDEYWEEMPSDAPGIAGRIDEVFTAATGSTTLSIVVGLEQVRLESLSPEFHPDVDRARVGLAVRAVGVEELEQNRFRLPPWGKLRIRA